MPGLKKPLVLLIIEVKYAAARCRIALEIRRKTDCLENCWLAEWCRVIPPTHQPIYLVNPGRVRVRSR